MRIQQKPVDQRRARTKLIAPHSVLAFTLCAIFFALCSPAAQAQQSKMYRVGILLPGEAWYEIIDGLLVNGPAIVTRMSSYPVRMLEWGQVQFYALVMMAGVLGFVAWYVWR